MQPYPCGCRLLDSSDILRCDEHLFMTCHYSVPTATPGECPPCRRLRWLSIGFDSALSTLARARDESEGAEPHVRLGEPGEFPDHLTQHSKVRSA